MNVDEKFMLTALKEAEKGKGLTYPNPAVGAVIVHNNKIISKGFHKKSGGPHAEINALKKIDFKVPKNSVMYVTLEPCSHYGKTPPCADAIIKHKFKKVVIGTADINPLVKGNGIKKLKQNNIEVITGVLENKCKLLNEDFFYYITEKKCFVTVKTALTLDGKTASVTGNSKWITNEKARRFGHYLRKINSCVLIGTNTLKTDNPNLNIRLYKNKYKHNTNIAVLDKNLCFNTKLNVFKNNPAENIFVFTASQNKQKINKLKKNGVNIIKTKLDKQGLINIKQVLKFLYKQGFLSVMVEGGSTLNYNLFKNKLVNKIHYIFAPKILGNGIPAVNGKLSDTIKNSIQIKNVSIKKIDDNFMVTGYCI